MYRMTDSLPDSIPGFCRGTHFQPLREVMLTETKENCNRLIMTGDGKEVEVTGEVYDAWQKSRRHEKYQQERKKREREMSVGTYDCLPADAHLAGAQGISPVEETVMADWLRGILRDALARLPPKELEAVWMLYFEGLTVTEAARRAGCKRDTVRNRERRAVRKMAEVFRERHVTDWACS